MNDIIDKIGLCKTTFKHSLQTNTEEQYKADKNLKT